MLAALLGCAVEAEPPIVEAHAAGAGFWPANSRTAVLGAIELGLPAIELDVVATHDRVPVLHSDPFLDPGECIRSDGYDLLDRVRIRALTAERLTEAFLCGGSPDPDHPNALVVDEPLATLAEIVRLLPSTGIDQVRLDVRYQPLVTPRPEGLARAILDVWERRDLPQVLSVTSDNPAVLDAFAVEAHLRGRDLSLGLVREADGVAQELDRWANGLDYAAIAESAGADTLWLPPDGLDLRALAAARAQGVRIGVGPVDDPRELRYWLRSGAIDLLSTNYPGDTLPTEGRPTQGRPTEGGRP